MSVSLLNIQPRGLITGPGVQLRAAQMSFCTPLKNSPMQVTIPINWATYGANSGTPVLIELDLSILGSSQPLDAIRSCYIDNTFSPTPVYVIFPDTQFVVVIPPNSVVLSPVWTNGFKFQLFGTNWTDGNIPSTTFEFSNVNVPVMSVIPANFADKVPLIRFIGQVTQNSAGQFRFFPNFNFGTALGPSRQIIICAYGCAPTALGCLPSQGTIGASNSLLVSNANSLALVGGIFTGVAIMRFNVASTVTVANVGFDFSAAGGTGAVLEVYEAYNLTDSPTSVFDRVGFNSPGPGSLPTPTPGVALYASNMAGFAVIYSPIGISNVTGQNATLFTTKSARTLTKGLTLSLNSSIVPSNGVCQCAGSFQ